VETEGTLVAAIAETSAAAIASIPWAAGISGNTIQHIAAERPTRIAVQQTGSVAIRVEIRLPAGSEMHEDRLGGRAAISAALRAPVQVIAVVSEPVAREIAVASEAGAQVIAVASEVVA